MQILNVSILKVSLCIIFIIYIYFFINLVFWQIVKKFEEKDEIISYFIKLGLKSDINLYSSIIYKFPSMDSRKYKSYEFPTIEETFFLEKSISKYEIPQFIQDIPEGFSLFCTLWEASKVKQYMLLSQDEQDKLNIKENYDKKEKENNFEEPIPKNNFCYICQKNFEEYLSHIESNEHISNLYEQNPYLIKSIKNTFKRINKFWSNENTIINSSTSNNEISSNESIEEEESISDKNTQKEKEENNKMKLPILSSSIISLIKETNASNEIESNNKEENKENIDVNKNEQVANEHKNKFARFKLLNKKRITFDVIRYESPTKRTFECKRKDYFNYLNKYKTKKYIRNMNVFFE